MLWDGTAHGAGALCDDVLPMWGVVGLQGWDGGRGGVGFAVRRRLSAESLKYNVILAAAGEKVDLLSSECVSCFSQLLDIRNIDKSTNFQNCLARNFHTCIASLKRCNGVPFE